MSAARRAAIRPIRQGRRAVEAEPAKPTRQRTRPRVVLDELPPVMLTGGGQPPRLLEAVAELGGLTRPVASLCPECGRAPGVNADSTFRAHRPAPDTFAGPHCPGGRPKGRQ